MINKRSKNKLKSSSNMLAAVLLVLALFVIISLLSKRHYIRWDLTAAKEHTLSDKTLQVLKTIQEPVKILAFARKESRYVEQLLSAYHYKAPNITYELIDPDQNPAITRRYKVRTLNTLMLEGYDRSQKVKIPQEENLTNALIRLTKNEPKKIYWITGHGERMLKGSEPESLEALQESLSKENYMFVDIKPTQKDIPDDAALIIVAAPEKPLFKVEVESLRKYISLGGRVLIFLEPFKDGGLKNLLKDYGIIISPDIVVDKLSRVMGGNYLLPMVTSYGSHEITRGFRLTSFFHMARSVENAGAEGKNIKATGLAFTSQNSWGETDRHALNNGKVRFDKKDRQGPLSLAVIAEIEPVENKKGKNGKIVVFGDVDFASNKFFNMSGNGDLIINTINYLTGRGDLITIKKKQKPAETLILTRNQGLTAFWIPVVLIPLIVLTIGIVVWNRRRSR